MLDGGGREMLWHGCMRACLAARLLLHHQLMSFHHIGSHPWRDWCTVPYLCTVSDVNLVWSCCSTECCLIAGHTQEVLGVEVDGACTVMPEILPPGAGLSKQF